jgi:hypothetical protein
MIHRLLSRYLTPLAATVLMAACATPTVYQQDTGTVMEHPSEAGGRLKPMPIRPLNVQADCRFKASVSVPKRGSCHFDLADFEQVRKEPHVELRARDGCVVRMWEQGDQVTVAFAQCASRCDRNTFDYVWPILVDRPSGRCN